jgi:outer membrane lipoprotein LolB
VAALHAQPDWAFQGRVAVSKGKDGGSGRIDWKQDGRRYVVELSAPVTRQSWKLTGDTHSEAGRLEGAGGPRDGEDAQQLLLEATGWDIPVNQLPEWIRGLVAGDAAGPEKVERDGEGRPRRMQQMGWQVQYLDWYPADAGDRRCRAGSRPAMATPRCACWWTSGGRARHERRARRRGLVLVAGPGQAEPVPAHHWPPGRRLPRAADRVPPAGLGRPHRPAPA